MDHPMYDLRVQMVVDVVVDLYDCQVSRLTHRGRMGLNHDRPKCYPG